MPKFRETLLLAQQYGPLSDEEFVLLYDLNKPKNPDIRYWNYDSFDIETLCDDECATNFRFFRNDVYALAEVSSYHKKWSQSG